MKSAAPEDSGRKVVRVLIADDHDVVRRGLRALIEAEPGFEVCAETDNGRDAVRESTALKPDIAVLDVSMPELNGLEAARRIRSGPSPSEVLLITMHDSDELLKEALAIGVRGYVLKSDSARELLVALRALTCGKAFLSSGIANSVVATYFERAATGEPLTKDRLTPREREVVQLLAEGKSNKEVATILGVAVKTVESHRANIFAKLGLHSMAELVRYAVRNMIVQA